MDKGKLKNFAIEARKRLIDHVGARIRYILTHETVEFVAKADLVKKLRAAWENSNDHDAFIEMHAYTLFNRLIALRYMDVKGYNFVPVVSPRATGGDPAILADARNGIFQPELPIDLERVSALLGGKVPTANPFNEAFKLLFIGACAGFNKTMPFMFEPLNSYAELLLPDDLLSANSIVAFINSNLGEQECENVEVIGWLYQFYIQEKKDKVFDDKKNAAKRKKDEIAAITQLFTPAWIVKYMVQNGLGKLWLLNNPASPLKDEMQYYVASELTQQDAPVIKSPEEIKVLDPCAGSGHTLVYSFDILMKIYEESGYYQKDIPALILQYNLTGLELDNRAAALANFALMMKAREYDRNILERGIRPKVYSLDDDRMLHPWDVDGARLPKDEAGKADYLAAYFKDADILGSLLDPKFSAAGAKAEMFHDEEKKEQLEARANTEVTGLITIKEKLEYSESVYKALAAKYHFVVTNPPYLPGNSNPVLKNFLEKHYNDSKSDLFAAFIERCAAFTGDKCFTGMITQHAWMFLSSFEGLRKKLIEKYFIDSMAHLGARAFEEIGGEVVQVTAFVLNNAKHDARNGTFLRLVDIKDARLKEEKFLSGELRYVTHQSNFSKIPGAPIAYWVSERFLKVFDHPKLEEITISDGQNKTGDNERFLRFYWEVDMLSVGNGVKWLFYAKGGEFRKWYGNIQFVVDWSKETRDFYRKDKIARIIPEYLWNQPGITWSLITARLNSFRILGENSTFDVAGSSIFFKDKNLILVSLALLNSNLSERIIKIFNPTMSLQVRDIRSIPTHEALLRCPSNELISSLTETAISISREDWDARETSWDFKESPLLTASDSPLLEERYRAYRRYWADKFFELHRNEEELNRIFIDIYGLQEELTPDVELKDVTILQQEKIITEEGGLDFNTAEVVRQFISYTVGCMFGRYSLDAPALILANQGETLDDYLAKVPEPRFTPDDDNIIPVLDDEYFHDDIVFRFNRFLEAALGSEEFDRNLQFIESALGMTLRRYFTNEFYKDHLKRYKKRPIYWMVSSPAGSFKALIYMHRYNTQTMSKIYNDYLKEFASKLNARLKDLQDGIIHTPNPVREEEKLRRAIKDTEDLLIALTPFALNPVEIDLDDGVKANLLKFKGAVVQV